MLAGNAISILLMVRLSINAAGPLWKANAILFSVTLACIPGLVFVSAYTAQGVDLLIVSYVLLALALAFAAISRFSRKKTPQNTVSTSPSFP